MLGEKLGEGNAAVVYKGKMMEGWEGEDGEGREVAVKMVKKKSLGSLFEEVGVMLGLNHPNIVKMFGVCSVGVS